MADFDVLSAAYDAMINWEKRLAFETPLYRAVFDEIGAKSVLDAACGTGRHAALFASWGLEVEGADLSEEMIAECRRKYAGRANLSFAARSFLAPSPRQFDAVVCVGNSLALVRDMDEVDQAVRSLVSSCRPGGAVIVHVLNMRSREEGPVKWDKHMRVKLGGGEYLLTKGTHLAGPRGFVDVILSRLDVPSPTLESHSVAFLSLRSERLVHAFTAAGCCNIRLWGSYGMSPFAEGSSGDLLVLAFRSGLIS